MEETGSLVFFICANEIQFRTFICKVEITESGIICAKCFGNHQVLLKIISNLWKLDALIKANLKKY